MTPDPKAICAPFFSPPDKEQLRTFSKQVQHAVNQQRFNFEIREVCTADALPWDPATKTFDCVLTLDKVNPFAFEGVNGRSIRGSGAGTQIVEGFCHAFSEAFERLSISMGGQSELRPSPTAVYSLLQNSWLDIGINPLVKSQANHHYSRSGEAFHVDRSQAFRAAFCEVLERAAISYALTDPDRCNIQDITAYACASLLNVQACQQYWTEQNYDFRILAVDAGFKLWVVLAVVLARNESAVVRGVRGSAADFKLDYAITQAMTEMGRYRFYGVPRQFDQDTLSARLANPLNRLDFERLSLFQDPSVLDRIRKRAVHDLTPSEINDRTKDSVPVRTIQHLLNQGQDIWIIPISDQAFDISGTCYKIICPGFPQEPGFLQSIE